MTTARIAKRVQPFGTTIFSEINALAQQHQAVNLGQGRPDFDGPQAVIDAFIQALQTGSANQYAPGAGYLPLREGIANHAARAYGLSIDPEQGVIVTPGATEAIFAAIVGLVDAGDEVIVIEPFFDSYVPSILMAGAVPVAVPMHPPTWTFDEQELRAAFSPKTRAIILNTPHNPTGRVYTHDELAMIAALCREFEVTVISDEVYEHLIFDDAQHIAMASLPQMFERTVTIGSAGKAFGMTGWKIGWLYGHPDLVRGVGQAHQYIAFAANHPAQVAVAHAFTLPPNYYADYRALYTTKRDLLVDGLTAAGFSVHPPQGTFFAMADFSQLFDGDADTFSRHLIAEIGVAAIPPASFYSDAHRHIGDQHLRFAFCKNDDTLHQAAERLAKLRQRI